MTDEVKSLGFLGELKSLGARAVAWEQANPRKVALALIYLSTHSTRLKPVIGFVGVLLGLNLGCSAPGTLTPAAQAEFDRVECVAHALRPVLLADAEDAAKALADGRVTLDELLQEVRDGKQLVAAVKADVEACK